MIWIWKTITLWLLGYGFGVMILDIIFTSGLFLLTSGLFLLLYITYVNGERRK